MSINQLKGCLSMLAANSLPADTQLSVEYRQRLKDRVQDQLRDQWPAFAVPTWLKTCLGSKYIKKAMKLLPWVAFGGTVALRFTMSSPAMAIGACIFGAVSLATRRSATVQRMIDKVGKRRCFRLVAGLIFGGTLWMSQTSPVFAQFFQGAEDFFNATFPDAGEVVPVVFGVIRALFLIYIAVALVRVVQAARNDDDWQQMARQPIIIVMAVVLGDVLTGLVVGAG